MNILNQLTWSSLKLNRKRTIVTIIGILLSAAMICATVSITTSFQDLFIERAKETDGNFHATFYEVEQEKSKYLTENTYTKTAMFSRDLGFARFELSTIDYRPYFFIKEYDSTALEHMPIKLTAGRYPEKSGEILLSEEILDYGGEEYQVGQTIALDLGERSGPQGEPLPESTPWSEEEQFFSTETQVYTITGLIARPHFENFSSIPGFTAVTYLDTNTLGATEKVNVSILGKKPRQIYDRVPEMAAGAGDPDYAYNNELLRYLGLSENDRAMAMIHSVAAIVILLIAVGSVTVIYNAFAISVSERKKQFGLLASSGATPGQIRRTVFFEGAILGLIGIPLGLLAGFGGIGLTLSVVNRLMSGSMFNEEMALRLVISPYIIPITVAVVALIIFISAYIPAKRAAAISPIEAIRLSEDIRIRGKNVKTSRLTRWLFGVEGELAMKNLKRNRRRYRTTVFSLFISIVLFVSFSSFINFALLGGGLYYQEAPFDFSIMAHGVPPEEHKKMYEQISALEEVERCTMYREIVTTSWLEEAKYSPILLKNFTEESNVSKDGAGNYECYLHLVALGEKEFKFYTSENGIDAADFQDTTNFKGILANKSVSPEVMAEFKPLKIKAGEKLTLEGLAAGREERDIPKFIMEVGAVTENLPLGYSSTGIWSADIIVSDEVFETVRSMIHNEDDYPYTSLEFYLITSGGAGLEEQLNTICKSYTDERIYVLDVAAAQQEMRRTTLAISIFLYGFIILITLIGVTNIFNTISTNVALRRREFAMLKSVGLTPKGFNKIINYESIFYGLKALLYGLPVSILISLGMYNSFGNFFHFTFFLPWKEILICVAGVFVIVFITMLHASSRMKRENIIEALKEETL